ncbi:hypothetical protein ACFL0W_03800 [Nanoarchaeota archaeon]
MNKIFSNWDAEKRKRIICLIALALFFVVVLSTFVVGAEGVDKAKDALKKQTAKFKNAFVLQSLIILAPAFVVLYYVLKLDQTMKIASMAFVTMLYIGIIHAPLVAFFSKFPTKSVTTIAFTISWVVTVGTVILMKYKGHLDKDKHLMAGLLIGAYSWYAMPFLGFRTLSNKFIASVVAAVWGLVPFFNLEEKTAEVAVDTYKRMRGEKKEESAQKEEMAKLSEAVMGKMEQMEQNLANMKQAEAKGDREAVKESGEQMTHHIEEAQAHQRHMPHGYVAAQGTTDFAYQYVNAHQPVLVLAQQIQNPASYGEVTERGKAHKFLLGLFNKLLSKEAGEKLNWAEFTKLKHENFHSIISVMEQSSDEKLMKWAEELKKEQSHIGLPELLKMMKKWLVELKHDKQIIDAELGEYMQLIHKTDDEIERLGKLIEQTGEEMKKHYDEFNKLNPAVVKMLDVMIKDVELLSTGVVEEGGEEKPLTTEKRNEIEARLDNYRGWIEAFEKRRMIVLEKIGPEAKSEELMKLLAREIEREEQATQVVEGKAEELSLEELNKAIKEEKAKTLANIARLGELKKQKEKITAAYTSSPESDEAQVQHA